MRIEVLSGVDHDSSFLKCYTVTTKLPKFQRSILLLKLWQQITHQQGVTTHKTSVFINTIQAVKQKSSWNDWPQRWRHYTPPKHQQPSTSQHNVIVQKTWTFIWFCVENWKHQLLKLCLKNFSYTWRENIDIHYSIRIHLLVLFLYMMRYPHSRHRIGSRGLISFSWWHSVIQNIHD